MRIINIGEGFFFFVILKIKEMATRIANIIMPLKSGANPCVIIVKFNSVLSVIVIAVARISATTHGRTPFRKA